MINFIQISNRSIIINNKKTVNMTLEKYIDYLLINDLSTYSGRMKSIRKRYGYRKLVPIYINDNLCLIPLENKKSLENIYLNIYEINVIEETGCIIFNNGDSLLINKKTKTLYKYILRAKSIKKSTIII